jgi:hypothetical protein
VLKVGNHLFDGPYEDFSTLQDKPGVYVIVCYESPLYSPIACGESNNVRESVNTHKGASTWKNNCQTGSLMVGVLYTSDGHLIEKELRSSIFFSCGNLQQPPSSPVLS